MNARHKRSSKHGAQRRVRRGGLTVGFQRTLSAPGLGSLWAYVAVRVAADTLEAAGLESSQLGCAVYRQAWPNAVTWGLRLGSRPGARKGLPPSRFDHLDALDAASDRGAERLHALYGDNGVREQAALVDFWIGKTKLVRAEHEALAEALSRLSCVAIESAAATHTSCQGQPVAELG